MANLAPAVLCLGVAFLFTCFESPVAFLWSAMAIGYGLAAWWQRC